MKKTTFLILIVFALMQTIWAKDNVNILKKTIPLDREKTLEVKIAFAAGALYIHPGKSKDLFKCELKFTEDEPTIDYTINEGTGILEISTPGFSSKDEEGHSYNFKGLDDIKQNTWHLYFSPDIPIKFVIENGAAENRFEFGSLRIKDLNISTGASETYMNFSEPNPIVMRRFYIESGVSEIKGKNLLNANFDKFRFEGGVGDYDFFFTGKLKSSPRIDIEIGIASARIFLDERTPFKARINSSFLSSIDIENADEEDDDYWISHNYNRSKDFLNISADVGIGGFKILVLD